MNPPDLSQPVRPQTIGVSAGGHFQVGRPLAFGIFAKPVGRCGGLLFDLYPTNS
jgi:hypothetical protein